MKRNYKKAQQKKSAKMDIQTIAKIFELAYMAGVAHFNSMNEWTDKDTAKMQGIYNKFIQRQKPAEKKSKIIIPPNIIKK